MFSRVSGIQTLRFGLGFTQVLLGGHFDEYRMEQRRGIGPKSYVCSFCGHRVGPALGFHSKGPRVVYIYICSYCTAPTYFDLVGSQFPSPAFGNPVESLPDGLAALYNEARSCAKSNSYTSAVLTCRKLLMHIAVEKGAPENQSFLQYVEYLATEGYVPRDAKGWVDHIRTKGNEANHDIVIMSRGDAENLITFSEMLLKFIYEFPAKIKPPEAKP